MNYVEMLITPKVILLMKWQFYISFIVSLVVIGFDAQAQNAIVDLCPSTSIQVRSSTFEPGGIILTSFDSLAIWVYDIERNTRYPLPETRPCTSNCHLSLDADWFIYLDPVNYTFGKMRLDGTQRTALVTDAADVSWWNRETLLIWTTDQRAYLRPENDTLAEADFLLSDGVISIQPNGTYALQLDGGEGVFNRFLVNLENPEQAPVLLSLDRTYFNASQWSPNGQYLAYVGSGAIDDSLGISGGEIFVIDPLNPIPQQLTNLTTAYGAVRINGYAPHDLSWSPDGTKLAFWVIELNSDSPTENTSDATLHSVDITTGEFRRYCGFTANEHTPETPRIIWSPDSSNIAFASNLAGDEKGALLLTLDIETGIFTELSNGMFPVYGIPQLNAWGNRP